MTVGPLSAGTAEPAKWRDLGVRATAALVLIPLALCVVWLGTHWFEIVIAAIAALMAREWVKLAQDGSTGQLVLHLLAALIAAGGPSRLGVHAVLGVLVALWIASVLFRQWERGGHSLWTVVGIPYVSLSALAFVLLRSDDGYGLAAILWVLIIVWSADTVAYFAGRIVGGPKLWPRVSPGKTWSGLGGAVVGGAIASLAAAELFSVHAPAAMLLAGGILGIVEQGGDLFESALKRKAGVKDSANLIPGHGGMLDRVDGLVAAVFFAAVIGVIRGGLDHPAAGLLSW